MELFEHDDFSLHLKKLQVEEEVIPKISKRRNNKNNTGKEWNKKWKNREKSTKLEDSSLKRLINLINP